MLSASRVDVPDLHALASDSRRRPDQASALGLAAWIQEETGARPSEIAALQFEDVDVAGRRIRLHGGKKRGVRPVSISINLAMALYGQFTIGCLQDAIKLGDEFARLSSPTVRRAFAHGRYRFLRQATVVRYYRGRPSH